MRGVNIQFSKLNSSTACTMALNKNPDTRNSSPSLLKILFILFHIALTHDKFLTTSNQSSSAAKISRPRYQKEVKISRGSP